MAIATYFKLNGNDLSHCISKLKVKYKPLFKSATNVNSDLTVDYINTKREIEVEFISLKDSAESRLILNNLTHHDTSFAKEVGFRNPDTGQLETVLAIPSDVDIEYYTLAASKERWESFKVKFKEL